MLPERPRPQQLQRFDWPEAAAQCARFALRFPGARGDDDGRGFTAAADGSVLAHCRVPLLLPPVQPGEAPADFVRRLPASPGRHCLLLLQAGAAALGYWRDDELLEHKAIKTYVVRGHGKAQPKHQKTRGASRYGARLRLQNWKRLLITTNQRLRQWWQRHGAPEQVFVSVNVRVLPELFAAEPPPPFTRDEPTLRRVPRHVHVPDFAELQAVRAFLAGGRVEIFAAS